MKITYLAKSAPGTLFLTFIMFALFLTWLSWRLTGGNLYFVSTPSMGTTAPVGSLVVSVPVNSKTPLKKGDIILYRIAHSNAVFVHRIYQVLPNGDFRTKGDLEALADPLVINRSEVVGISVEIIPALGWVYRLSGYLLGVASCTILLSFALNKFWRHVIYVMTPALFIVVPLVLFHPLVSATVLETDYFDNQVHIYLVDTAILPVTYHVYRAKVTSGSPGQEVIITAPAKGPDAIGHVIPIGVRAKLYWWEYLILITVSLVPVVIYLVIHFHLGRYFINLEANLGLHSKVS
jgi:signal peptidase I